MNRWINILFGIVIVLVMSVCYLANASTQAMALLLLFFVTSIFIREQTQWAVVYLGVAINLLYLFLALWLMDGQISFLTDELITPFYKKALLLETVFWATFSGLLGLYIDIVRRGLVDGTSLLLRYPVQLQFMISIAILAIEIMISSGEYFQSYVDVSDTGTIAYELGCVFLALAIVSRSENPLVTRNFVLEMIAVALALFIVVGSGKRLPFAYVIMAYMLYSLRYYGKLRTAILYLVISGLGFVQGILRDFMSVDGINTNLLTSGMGSSNQGAVLHASAVYLRVADEGLISVIDRGISFLSNFVGALILPLSFLPEQAQINVHAMKYYDLQGNGGFVGTYSYFFLDWIGPTLFASSLALLCCRHGHWLKLFVIIILLTSPRWTLYNIGPVLRLISMVLILFICINLLFRILLNNSRSKTSFL